MLECHEVPRLETPNFFLSDPFCRSYHRRGHTALTRTVASGCRRNRKPSQTLLNPHTPKLQQEPSGTLCVREKSNPAGVGASKEESQDRDREGRAERLASHRGLEYANASLGTKAPLLWSGFVMAIAWPNSFSSPGCSTFLCLSRSIFML